MRSKLKAERPLVDTNEITKLVIKHTELLKIYYTFKFSVSLNVFF